MAFLTTCRSGSFSASIMFLSAAVSAPSITRSICLPSLRETSRTSRGKRSNTSETGSMRTAMMALCISCASRSITAWRSLISRAISREPCTLLGAPGHERQTVLGHDQFADQVHQRVDLALVDLQHAVGLLRLLVGVLAGRLRDRMRPTRASRRADDGVRPPASDPALPGPGRHRSGPWRHRRPPTTGCGIGASALVPAASRLATVRATESRRTASLPAGIGSRRMMRWLARMRAAMGEIVPRAATVPWSGAATVEAVPNRDWRRRPRREGTAVDAVGFALRDAVDQGGQPCRIGNRHGEHRFQPAQRRRQQGAGGMVWRRASTKRRNAGQSAVAIRPRAASTNAASTGPPVRSPVTESSACGGTGASRTCSPT